MQISGKKIKSSGKRMILTVPIKKFEAEFPGRGNKIKKEIILS